MIQPLIIFCSMFPRSTHETFVQKLYQTFKDHKRFSKPKLSRSDFTISHYAGEVSSKFMCPIWIIKPLKILESNLVEKQPNNCKLFILMERFYFQVTYQTEHFLDKNKDYVVAEHQDLLSASKCSFVSGLFPPLPEESSKSSKFSSIGSRFKVRFFF